MPAVEIKPDDFEEIKDGHTDVAEKVSLKKSKRANRGKRMQELIKKEKEEDNQDNDDHQDEEEKDGVKRPRDGIDATVESEDENKDLSKKKGLESPPKRSCDSGNEKEDDTRKYPIPSANIRSSRISKPY